VLGTTGVVGEDGLPVDIPARKRRAILAALVLRREGASADALLDLVWGDSPQRAGHGSLHSYVSGLRRALEPGLGPRQRPTTLLTTDQGYRLALPPDHVDARRPGRRGRRSPSTSTRSSRLSRPGPATRTPTCRTTRTSSPSAARWRSCA
jgi:DNA-binding winged helix-turn-helix (wHTH) protein